MKQFLRYSVIFLAFSGLSINTTVAMEGDYYENYYNYERTTQNSPDLTEYAKELDKQYTDIETKRSLLTEYFLKLRCENPKLATLLHNQLATVKSTLGWGSYDIKDYAPIKINNHEVQMVSTFDADPAIIAAQYLVAPKNVRNELEKRLNPLQTTHNALTELDPSDTIIIAVLTNLTEQEAHISYAMLNALLMDQVTNQPSLDPCQLLLQTLENILSLCFQKEQLLESAISIADKLGWQEVIPHLSNKLIETKSTVGKDEIDEITFLKLATADPLKTMQTYLKNKGALLFKDFASKLASKEYFDSDDSKNIGGRFIFLPTTSTQGHHNLSLLHFAFKRNKAWNIEKSAEEGRYHYFHSVNVYTIDELSQISTSFNVLGLEISPDNTFLYIFGTAKKEDLPAIPGLVNLPVGVERPHAIPYLKIINLVTGARFVLPLYNNKMPSEYQILPVYYENYSISFDDNNFMRLIRNSEPDGSFSVDTYNPDSNTISEGKISALDHSSYQWHQFWFPGSNSEAKLMGKTMALGKNLAEKLTIQDQMLQTIRIPNGKIKAITPDGRFVLLGKIWYASKISTKMCSEIQTYDLAKWNDLQKLSPEQALQLTRIYNHVLKTGKPVHNKIYTHNTMPLGTDPESFRDSMQGERSNSPSPMKALLSAKEQQHDELPDDIRRTLKENNRIAFFDPDRKPSASALIGKTYVTRSLKRATAEAVTNPDPILQQNRITSWLGSIWTRIKRFF
jgi:hypothetical protein